MGRGTAVVLLLVTALAPPALAQGPASEPPATLTEARALINQGKPQEALQRLLALDANDPQVAYLQGVAHYHVDDYPQAIAKLSPVVGQLKDGSIERREAVQVLGLSLYLAGRLVEALPLPRADASLGRRTTSSWPTSSGTPTSKRRSPTRRAPRSRASSASLRTRRRHTSSPPR